MNFSSLLVANRGEIALRVMRTAKRMGLRTIAVYSDADRDAPHVRAADEAVHIGAPSPRDSYLNVKAILQAEGEAVHPGYGFLSESADFAEAVLKSGRVWVGPPPAAMRAMGDKANAKAIAARAGVPVLPTYEKNPEFPVMIKALAGGGGRGIRIVFSQSEFQQSLETSQSEAEHSFGDSRVLLEKALLNPRHVEVQIFADQQGNCIHLGERDCSVQRRHQKLLEESPSPALEGKMRAQLRADMGAAAVAVARAVGYVGAGTVEFLLEDGKFWFMEMNTRLQVEHPVTEMVTGLDLVEWQLRVAAGEPLPAKQDDIRFSGHAIEVRLCAEDPATGFLPQAGTLALWEPSSAVRVEHALESGMAIPPFYDSMIAKLIVHAPTRDKAREKLAAALDETVALGIPTNKDFLASVLRNRSFANGEATTDFLSHYKFESEDSDIDFGEWTGWSNNPAHRSRGSESFFQRNTPNDPLRLKSASDGRLVAPMNGRVVAVNAKAGDRIDANKALVVLEAMKMEHGLQLPFAVQVNAIHVTAGAQVAPGRLLVEYEPT